MLLKKLGFLSAALCVLMSHGAQAEPKGFGGWGWSHWERLRNFQPYIEDPTQTQNLQWERDPWKPSDWTDQKAGGGREVLEDLFNADVLRRFYVWNHLPAVDVGPGFYMLGGQDQRRVTALIDDVYGITSKNIYGMFTLYDWNTKRPVGVYNQYGLQMK